MLQRRRLGCNGRFLSALATLRSLSTPSMAGYHYDLNFLTIHGKSNFPGLNIWYCHYHHASQPSPALSCIHLRSRQGVGPEGRSGSARPAMGLLCLEELVQAGTPGGAGTGRAQGDYGIRRMVQVPRRMLHVCVPGCAMGPVVWCACPRDVSSCRYRMCSIAPPVQRRTT